MTASNGRVAVTITRWVDDDPQPGIVEYTLTDIRGERWLFEGKTAWLSEWHVRPESAYPIAAWIFCIVFDRSVDDRGREIFEIEPDYASMSPRESTVWVFGDQLVEPNPPSDST